MAQTMNDRGQTAFGGVDIAAYNAGRIIKERMSEFTNAEFDCLTDDNAGTIFHWMGEAARHLRNDDGGINEGSSLTAGTAPEYAVYAGTKAPVEVFARILAR